jgi:hypothetical protein
MPSLLGLLGRWRRCRMPFVGLRLRVRTSGRLRRWLLLLCRLPVLRLLLRVRLRLRPRSRRRLLGLSAGLRPRLRLRAGCRRLRGELLRLLCCFGGGLWDRALRGRRGTGDCSRAALGALYNCSIQAAFEVGCAAIMGGTAASRRMPVSLLIFTWQWQMPCWPPQQSTPAARTPC